MNKEFLQEFLKRACLMPRYSKKSFCKNMIDIGKYIVLYPLYLRVKHRHGNIAEHSAIEL
jgi:hypothetical protein